MDNSLDHNPGSDTHQLVQRLIPANLMFLIRERPTFGLESAAEYDAIRDAIFADPKPRDTVEILLIKELADYFWEIRQLQRLKPAAIHDRLPYATDTLCGGPNFTPEEQARKQEFWSISTRAAIASDDDVGRGEIEALNSRVRRAGISSDIIHCQAYSDEFDRLERISRAIERVVAMRDRLLRQIEDRRAALGAMARSLVKREAEIIDVEATE